MFKDAYRRRRCIFCWSMVSLSGKQSKARGPSSPYAIAMKDGTPFGIGTTVGKLEGPDVGRVDTRTFVVITTDANELVAQIHNRMPLTPAG
jgi:putative SOS response-associated peptidase YedK